MKKKFEEEGFVFDKERVLIYSQLYCPLGCRYCFTGDLKSNQRKDVAYLSERQIELLKQLPNKVKLIMLGCDTEFFQDPANALRALERLSNLDRDISLVTKMYLAPNLIKKLKDLDNYLRNKGNSLTLSFSIPCMESAKTWEPKVTKPEMRIRSLRTAHDAELSTFVAIRPLLPMLSNDELCSIIESTSDFCKGYYSGPLYMKEVNPDLLGDLPNLHIEKIQPHWMPSNNIFYKVEKDGQMDFLRAIVGKSGHELFEGAAEAIGVINKNEKYRA
jgi:DNA repair photolyase